MQTEGCQRRCRPNTGWQWIPGTYVTDQFCSLEDHAILQSL